MLLKSWTKRNKSCKFSHDTFLCGEEKSNETGKKIADFECGKEVIVW